MSLETVLKIGKALRQTENSLRYFKYVQPCPVQKDKEGNSIYPLCLTIPVNEDFSFAWDNVIITPENERDDLYYLKFKTSDSDGLVKYVFGDIFYSKNSKITKEGSIEKTEGGFYRLENPIHTNAAFRSSSFNRGKKDFEDIYKSSVINEFNMLNKFHEAFKKEVVFIERVLNYIPTIEKLFSEENNMNLKELLGNETSLKELTIKHNYDKAGISNRKKMNISVLLDELNEVQKEKLLNNTNGSIFIHFSFPNEKHWYQYKNEVEAINKKILSDFVVHTVDGVVLKKTLYKTLCSGDKENDIQFPDFSNKNRYKAKLFHSETIQDLFYAIDFAENGRTISNTGIKIIILPLGENLAAKDYIEFLEKRDEARIHSNNKGSENMDSIFSFVNNDNNATTAFDLIFAKPKTKEPGVDYIEISGVEKSNLRKTMERIKKISSQIYDERKLQFKTEKDLFPFLIEVSFRNILGTILSDSKTGKVIIKANPKYQSHLLKILPAIYTDSYYEDLILLPAFIQNVEYSIRAGDERFSFLKFDLKFLLKIQNTQNDKFMEITNAESYLIGVKLGKLSRPLKKAINSFEKNYVGLLTRRVSTKNECIKFYNEINEKLIMHKKTWGQSSAEIAGELVNLPNAKYDKEKIAFGFLEGYFKYEAADKKKDFFTRLEKLLADYEGNQELENELEMLNELFQDIKN